jgi:hypothetical protein
MLHLGLLGALASARLAVAADAHFEIGRRCRPGRTLALALAGQIHQPEIMLGVLIEVFRRDPVAAGLRLPRQCDIPLEDLIGVATNLYARAIAVEGLDAVRRARPVVVVLWTATAAAPTTMRRTTATAITTA